MTLEELKTEFKIQGFKIEGNSFIHEFEDLNTIINGIHPKKRFEMEYVCEGCMRDAGDSDDGEPIYQFDVLGQNREPVVTICFGSFEEFKRLVG